MDCKDAGQTTPDNLSIGHLLAAQEHTLKTIATRLHDGPVQDVIAAQFLVSAMAGDDATRAVVQSTLHEVTVALRAMCQSLYPPALEPFGLFKAVESRIEKASALVSIALQAEGDDSSLSLWARRQLYRIVDELVANVETHAAAQHATVTLIVDDKVAAVRVVDDGVGIQAGLDTGAWTRLAQQGQYGLFMTSVRANALGGHLAIGPRPKGGTAAQVQLAQPLPDASLIRS